MKPISQKVRDWQRVQELGPGEFLPIQTVSEANQREHHFAKYRRKRAQHKTTKLSLLRAGSIFLNQVRASISVERRIAPPGFPRTRIVLTRYGPNPLDTDNLSGSFKHIRDEIARIVGVDDGDARWEWIPRQEVTESGKYGVRIELDIQEVPHA